MNIIVCVKRVPDTTEVEVSIDKEGKDIVKEGLVFDINEWDRYALEEAIRLKEKFGGSVTVVLMSPEAAEDAIRKGLAMGADRAIFLKDQAFKGADGYAVAKILCQVIKDLPFDLVLTGGQASDDGYGQVGVILAELLRIPHATLVTQLEILDKKARAHCELEGGLEEVIEIQLPAVFTIQTGINEPRYVSIMGIRKAAQKETKALNLEQIGLKREEVGELGSKTKLERVFLPPPGKEAEFLKGNPQEVAIKLVDILKREGGIA